MEEAPDGNAEFDAEIDEVNQPGLSQLREAVENHLKRLPTGGSLRQDGIAGLNSAVSSVPDGMASGILAGVNPIYGLYACMVGPIAGGIFSSTKLMIVATTSAASLAGTPLSPVNGCSDTRSKNGSCGRGRCVVGCVRSCGISSPKSDSANCLESTPPDFASSPEDR